MYIHNCHEIINLEMENRLVVVRSYSFNREGVGLLQRSSRSELCGDGAVLCLDYGDVVTRSYASDKTAQNNIHTYTHK